MKYTKDSLVGEVLDNDESLARYFFGDGDALPGLPILARRDNRASL